MSERLKNKKVSESVTESYKIIQYKDINGQRRLFGGRLMEWIDEVAALTAMRHCGGLVTTCTVDNLVFKQGAMLNQVVVLNGKVTYVGNTSLEVKVDTFVEDIVTGERKAINRAFLICVHVDDCGKPVPIQYGLYLHTQEEKSDWNNAQKRAKSRKERYS